MEKLGDVSRGEIIDESAEDGQKPVRSFLILVNINRKNTCLIQ